MSLLDVVRGIFAPAEQRSPRAPLAAASNGSSGIMASGGGSGFIVRPTVRFLRDYSVRNVWVRTAINRRKREISGADWAIVRTDDDKAQPVESVVKAAKELFARVNDKGVSLEWLLNMAVEDILVVDGAAIEIEYKAGGKIAALWEVDGGEIAPSATWDGSDPKAIRYKQIRDGRIIATYKNNELVYMMANPRSCSVVGLSPLEVLFATVQADLYGESFEYQLMKETAPAGLLYLGNMSPEKVDAFRDQWETDIAGTRDIVMLGGGGYDPDTGAPTPPSFTSFTRSAREELRRDYMKWLATKVAAAFEIDLMAFNLSESVHRAIGENLQAKTDQGLIGLAKVIASFITREIIWQLDPLHQHAFVFKNLTPEDAMQKAKIRQMYMSMGVTFPNEIRVEDGKEKVPWGDRPWPVETDTKAPDPAAEQTEGEQPEEDEPPKKPAGVDDEDEDDK